MTNSVIDTIVHPGNANLTNQLFTNFNNQNKTLNYKSQEIFSGL